MYEEKEYSINWFKIVLRLVIVLLVLLLSIKLISLALDKTNVKEDVKMEDRLKYFEEFATNYFNEENIPTKVGDSSEVSLEKLINDRLINDIKDEKGKKCNYKKSYIKATRLEKEYQIKTNLVCDKYSDYSNTFIKLKNTEDKKTEVKTTKKVNKTTKKVTTKKKTTVTTTTTTTKQVTTTSIKPTTTTTTSVAPTKKKYIISYNTNGGNLLNPDSVTENSKISYLPIPIRSGFRFIGWYYHGNRFDENTIINQDYVLVAKWVSE